MHSLNDVVTYTVHVHLILYIVIITARQAIDRSVFMQTRWASAGFQFITFINCMPYHTV